MLHHANSVVLNLSHRHLHTRFWIAESSEILQKAIPIEKLGTYPVPVLIEKFISLFFSTETLV